MNDLYAKYFNLKKVDNEYNNSLSEIKTSKSILKSLEDLSKKLEKSTWQTSPSTNLILVRLSDECVAFPKFKLNNILSFRDHSNDYFLERTVLSFERTLIFTRSHSSLANKCEKVKEALNRFKETHSLKDFRTLLKLSNELKSIIYQRASLYLKQASLLKARLKKIICNSVVRFHISIERCLCRIISNSGKDDVETNGFGYSQTLYYPLISIYCYNEKIRQGVHRRYIK